MPYWTNVNSATWLSPFHIVHRVEVVTLVECEIPLLKISIHVLPNTTNLEEFLLHLEHLDEKHIDALMENESHKNRVKN